MACACLESFHLRSEVRPPTVEYTFGLQRGRVVPQHSAVFLHRIQPNQAAPVPDGPKAAGSPSNAPWSHGSSLRTESASRRPPIMRLTLVDTPQEGHLTFCRPMVPHSECTRPRRDSGEIPQASRFAKSGVMALSPALRRF